MINFKKARDFIYSNATLLERSVFAYLFQSDTHANALMRVHLNLMGYKNPDGGFGHALEHDIRTPDSHPLALEYLLGWLVRDLNLPLGDTLAGTSAWLESVREPDGSLRNPASVRDYPHAPWWAESGGQTIPDSIVGNLTKLGMSTPSLSATTREWVSKNLTLDAIRGVDWLFMLYHAFDYFMNVDDFPNVQTYRAATIEQMRTLADKMPEKQYYVLLQFAPTPDSPVARAMPKLVARSIDYLLSTQRDDGSWSDEHGLSQWYPNVTIMALERLRTFGKWDGK